MRLSSPITIWPSSVVPERRVATKEEVPQRRVQPEETASNENKAPEPPKYKRV